MGGRMQLQDHKVLVLRHPEQQGNFSYWIAELPSKEAQRWQDRLTRGELVAEFGDTFGQPLTLNEVMTKLQSRDFQVLDYPSAPRQS
jgi:hypothetical protein